VKPRAPSSLPPHDPPIGDDELAAFAEKENLLLAIVTSVSAAVAVSSFRAPEELLHRIADEHLGHDGAAVLLLRAADSGDTWHRRSPDGRDIKVEPLSMRLLPVDRGADAEQAIRAWWMERRSVPGAVADLRGSTFEHGRLAIWRAGGWRNIGESLSERIVALRGAASAIPTVPPPASEEGELPVASWTAWVERGGDGAFRRLAVEFVSEDRGPVVGVLLLEAGRDAAPGGPEALEVALATSWRMAILTTQMYWTLWDRWQAIGTLRELLAANGVMTVDVAAASSRRMMEAIGNALQPLVERVARTFQVPAVGLFVPETSGDEAIGLLSHVGYRRPGLSFHDPAFERGLVGAFCFAVDATVTSTRHLRVAFQCADAAAYDAIRADVDAARGHGSPEGVGDDRNILPSLRVDRVPRAYASFDLDPKFWPYKRRPPRTFPERLLTRYGFGVKGKVRP
jgi:hypothetical protein